MPEVASAHLTLIPQIKDLKSSINKELGGLDMQGLGGSMGGQLSMGFAAKLGGIAGAVGAITYKAVTAITGALSSGLSGGIARLDTMENFADVMANLGQDSQVADAAISKMAEHLTGLPTRLDDMSVFVQSLTAMTGDLGRATDVGLAFNDMILAGGQGTYAAANAQNAYNRILAAGKADVDHWSALVYAAPAQMKQLSETLLGAGHDAWDLRDAINDGTISLDAMADAMIMLDEGGGAFESFETQARAATGGIQTSIENLHTAFARFNYEILKAIGQENIAAGIQVLTDLVNTAGKVFGAVIEGIKNSFIGEWLGNALEGLQGIAQSFKDGAGSAESLQQITENVSAALDDLHEKLGPAREALGTVFDDLKPVLEDIGIQITDNGAELEDYGNWWLEVLLPGVITALGIVAELVATVMGQIVQVGQVIAAFPGILAEGWNEAIMPMFESLWSSIKGFVSDMGTAFKEFADGLASAGEWIKEKFQQVVDFLSGIPGQIVDFFAFVGDGIAQPFHQAYTDVTGIFDDVVAFVSGIPGQIVEFFTGLGSKIVSAIGEIRFPQPQVTWEELMPGVLSVPKVTFAATGGIVTDPTIFGGRLVVGERNPEAIVPLDGAEAAPFADMVASRVNRDDGRIVELLEAILAKESRVLIDADGLVDVTAPYIDGALGSRDAYATRGLSYA